MTRRRRETDLIETLATDIARNDHNTTTTLALLRNGHPGSRPPIHRDTDGNGPPPHGDPTGEWAITPDQATHLAHEYTAHLYHAAKALIAADGIARQLLPIDTTREHVPDPDTWCKNCYQHGHCAPRNSKKHHYCRWCINIHSTWGFYPPKGIADLHHSGQHARIVAALEKHKRR